MAEFKHPTHQISFHTLSALNCLNFRGSEIVYDEKGKMKEAFQFLFQYKAIEFLKENYDIEHTLPLNEAIDDMMIICKKNGGILE